MRKVLVVIAAAGMIGTVLPAMAADLMSPAAPALPESDAFS